MAVGLLTGDTLDVDEVLETVDGGDLALTALVGTADNGDLVVLADGKSADLIRGKALLVLHSMMFYVCFSVCDNLIVGSWAVGACLVHGVS